MPDEPPRLFLSYGVRDASEIAERLRRDLTTRGYRVWQDVNRIRAGRPWDEEVREGLRTSQVVLELLSPQSVRRAVDAANATATDSVCLDETAYARDPCHIPIVPVKVMSCEAPFLLNRLHQIDFRRWNESEPVYQAGLDQIYEAIEAARRGEKRERTWSWLSKPWDFEPFLREKRKDFIGREWLFAEIDEWRVHGPQPALLITGEPGIGKSAIVAALVHENPGDQVLAYHCCQADTPATLDPVGFVWNLAAMLFGRLDDYAAMLEDPAIVKVLEEADQDPASAFEAAILAPLHQLPESAGTRRYLLIDALDEALTRTRGETIVNLLSSRVDRLPPWLRIVATTRNEQEVLDQLRGLTPRTLDAHDEQNLSDVRRSIADRLRSSTLQAAVIADSRSGEEITEKLLTTSCGNFLYVTTALKAVECGQLDFKRIELLPPGLSGMYKEFFDRLFVKAGVEFHQTRAVLEIVVAAQEPLHRQEIARATGLDEDYDLQPVLDRLAPFLPAQKLRHSLFHKSLSDWLCGKDPQTGRPLAGAYHVSLIKGRTPLADWCWAEYQRGVTKDHLYCLRHLPSHLSEAGRDADLRTVLLNFNWLQAKLESTDANALIADYNYFPEDKDSRFVQSAIRLSAHVLAGAPRQLAGQLTGRLLGDKAPNIQALLHQAAERKAWPWLRPLSPSITAPGGSLIRTLEGHTDEVRAVAVTPDGRWAVSACDDTLLLWDLKSGQTIRSLEGHRGRVTAVAVTADSRCAVSASRDHALRLWDLESGQTLRLLEGHTSSVNAVAITSDGRRAVSASDDHTLRLWDLETGQTLLILKGHTEKVNAVAVTPDGRRAVSDSSDRMPPSRSVSTIRLWDLGTGETICAFKGHTTHWGSGLAVTPDGRRAVWADDQKLRLWDLSRGRRICTLKGHTSWVNAVAITSDGRRVVSASSDRTLRVWDLESGQTSQRPEGPATKVQALAITPDGCCVISVSTKGERTAFESAHKNRLQMWDPKSGQAIRTLIKVGGIVACVIVTSADCHAISDEGDTIRIWKPAKNRPVAHLFGHDIGYLLRRFAHWLIGSGLFGLGLYFTILHGHLHFFVFFFFCVVLPWLGSFISGTISDRMVTKGYRYRGVVSAMAIFTDMAVSGTATGVCVSGISSRRGAQTK